MSSVLISTQPKWCEKICNQIGERNGKPLYEKTIEVRKTRPKVEMPFKVYIHETKGKQVEHLDGCDITYYGRGKVIGEFVCNRIDEYTAEFVNDGDCYEDVRRHWIDDDGEEDFEIITSNGRDNPEDCELFKNSCLSYAELKKYIGENFHDIPFYGWHISDLKIYDTPKNLSKFKKAGWLSYDDWLYGLYPNTHCTYDAWAKRFEILKPPQSWCYVEELK